MSATESNAKRDLLLADVALVQAQNVSWLSRRYGFTGALSEQHPKEDPLGIDVAPLPYLDLPAWKRWTTLLRLAVGRDDAARQRIKTAIGFRLLGPPTRR